MDEFLQQLTSLFEQIRQPVVILQDKKMMYKNPAAQAQLPTLMPAEAASLTDGPATLGGTTWQVSVRQMGDYRVLSLEPTELAALDPTQLLNVVSQALRGSLSAALSVSQSLFPRLEELENPRIQRSTAAINRSFYQLLRLAGNLSDVSSYLQGKRTLRRRQVEATQWIAALGEKLEPYCRLQQLRLEVQAPKEHCWIWIDTDEVERALLNLVSNAMKFTPAGGCIQLSLEIGATQLRLKVQDDGEGIEPEVLENLYWSAAERPMLGDPRWGVGLGMQLVRQVALAHGGTVLAERRERGGTCVTISLRREQPESSVLRNQIEFGGGFDPVLVELSDTLPLEAYDTKETQ